ncbi:UNVERIFIED_CONTAM: hypothetical protein FKN15_027368 [Acipenser sinensis]
MPGTASVSCHSRRLPCLANNTNESVDKGFSLRRGETRFQTWELTASKNYILDREEGGARGCI